jgi:hypothetical protein
VTRHLVLLASALLVGAFARPAAAQIVDNPRGAAMGTAVRGDPLGTSALEYNPAGMSRAYLYTLEGHYFRGGPGDRNVVGVAVVDSKTQPALAVGVGYGFEFTDGGADLEVQGHDIKLGFASALVPKKVHAGLTLNYLTYEFEGADPLDGFTLDAGMLFSITPALHLGLVGHDLINLDHPSKPRRAGGGVAYTGALLTLDVDALVDFDSQDDPKPVVATGLEILAAETVPLRLGYEWDGARETQWVSGGVGFISSGQAATGSQIGVTYRQSLDDTKSFLFGVGLTMFL